MALETLKNVKEIGGFKIIDLDKSKLDDQFFIDGEFNWEKYDEYRKDFPVSVMHSQNMVSFKIQKGPVKEVGVNGCQVDTLMHTALIMLRGLNQKYSCRENSIAITKLQEAIFWLEERKRDREARGVEGYDKE